MEGGYAGVKLMEPVVNSEVRELCKAVSEEEDSERLKNLLDELLTVLEERQLVASLLSSSEPCCPSGLRRGFREA